MIDKLAEHQRAIFKLLGYDLNDPHFAESPERIAAYLAAWHTQGFDPPKVTVFPNEENIDEMIADAGITFESMCAHHGLPFTGKVAVGYIPDKVLIGVSKFARVINHFANRFTVQERVTKQVADFLEAELKPKALGVVICAEHMCMSIRGVKKHGAMMITSDLRGTFRTSPEARAELVQLVKA